MKSSSTEFDQSLNELLNIEISKDSMEAYAYFMPPKSGGRQLTGDEVKKEINDSGVKYGVNAKLVEEFIRGFRGYGKKFILAKGERPDNGVDGSLRYSFDTDKKTFKPKELEDGSVDYRNLDLIETVEEGQVLVKVIPNTEGTMGYDVYGREVFGKDGKPAPRLPKGKNTRISEDESELIAEVAGQLVYLNGRVNINKVLEIQGDVGVSTGNINFNGSVIVRGNVLTDFKIVALGNVDIHGIIEGAEILCEGNLKADKGINGMNKANIEAKGNINALIIKDATVYAGGDVYADGIMHSRIKCNGKVQAAGKKGLLVGGKVSARDEIEAKVIGSPMATATDLNVGIDADVYERYKAYMAEMTTLQKEYEELSKTIVSMSKIKELNTLPAAKRNSYIKTIYDAQAIKKRLEALQEDIVDVKGELDDYKYHGIIKASSIIHPGVNVQIGNAILNIRDEIYRCHIINYDGRAKVIAQ